MPVSSMPRGERLSTYSRIPAEQLERIWHALPTAFPIARTASCGRGKAKPGGVRRFSEIDWAVMGGAGGLGGCRCVCVGRWAISRSQEYLPPDGS